MYTYQDLLELGEERRGEQVIDFIYKVIQNHKASELYNTAVIADSYDRHKNKTILEYQKLLYTITGEAVPDNYSANYKLSSKFFHRFVTQQNQFLLGNGIQWNNEQTPKKLGDDFDTQLQKAGHKALVGGVSFGFWNLDHMDVFSVMEFAPLLDEENGSIRAGVRFWQLQADKPLRATFFEEDGFTDYIWRDGHGDVLNEKRPYVIYTRETEVGDNEIFDWENYPTFPIVPLWGNPQHQSEIVGIREQIDAYDLIKSGFCNTVDEASMIYWTIQNAGGMDDVDLVKFIERMKTVHAATVDSAGATAEAHSVESPYQSRESLLKLLRKDLYEDFMALDTKEIASGAVTATQIKAAYEPLNSKTDDYEYCVNEFVSGILSVAGIEDEPTFTRSIMVNKEEEVRTVIQAAMFLDDSYVTEKILSILGDGDKAKEMIEQMDADEIERMRGEPEEPQEDIPEEQEEVPEEEE